MRKMCQPNSLTHEMQASLTWKIKVHFADVITTVCHMGSNILSHVEGRFADDVGLLKRASQEPTLLLSRASS